MSKLGAFVGVAASYELSHFYQTFGACPAEDLVTSYECSNLCFTNRNSCQNSCTEGDYECAFNCNTKADKCVSDCPCMSNCPLGCANCPYCACQSIEDINDDPNYVQCQKMYEIEYFRCASDCDVDDPSCINSCNRQYQTNLTNCPCQENCPSGCPCENYDCSNNITTTPGVTSTTAPSTLTNILVLNTNTTLKALKLNGIGQVDEDFIFGFGPKTEVYQSCAVIIDNKMVVFGGGHHKRQVSQVENCRLVRKADLPFDLENGACTRYDKNQTEKLMLCFDKSDGKKCYGSVIAKDKFDFQPLGTTKYIHENSHIATSYAQYKSQGLVIGSKSHVETEWFDALSELWTDVSDYPFASALYDYSIVSIDTAFYVFGGKTGGVEPEVQDLIARFKIDGDEDAWTSMGNLLNPRYAHDVVVKGSQFWVIGGAGQKQSESCLLNGDNSAIECSSIQPQLIDYSFYPEMMFVEYNYCKSQ